MEKRSVSLICLTKGFWIGMPEHLGTTKNEPYFVPNRTGDYSFTIVNDLTGSNASEAGTFMLIEHIDTNVEYSRYMEGFQGDAAQHTTAWSYEFTSSARRLQVLINAPATLDMYEARLYLTAAPSIGVGTTLIDDPLADESCLYEGIREGIFGRYNLKAPSVRFPDRVASCEFAGEDMTINYTSPFAGEILYHLVLIAEKGAGNSDFMIKTDYNPPKISLFRPADIRVPGEAALIQAKVEDNESGVFDVVLSYSMDNWSNSVSLQMTRLASALYEGRIPGLSAGTLVRYRILASDNLQNSDTS